MSELQEKVSLEELASFFASKVDCHGRNKTDDGYIGADIFSDLYFHLFKEILTVEQKIKLFPYVEE